MEKHLDRGRLRKSGKEGIRKKTSTGKQGMKSFG